MDVRIGKDNIIFISRNVLNKIFSTIRQYGYETGGIIGINTNGEIVEFHFDKPYKPNLFEYCPNVCLLNQIINGDWKQNNIEFAGFVHSHLNNSEISQQDVKYVKSVLLTNKCISYIILGIVNLNVGKNFVKWYKLDRETYLELNVYIEK